MRPAPSLDRCGRSATTPPGGPVRIVNELSIPVSYELKGGPLRMTLSKCDLDPGEEEVWESPYTALGTEVACELHVLVEERPLSVEAAATATVAVTSGPGGAVLQVR